MKHALLLCTMLAVAPAGLAQQATTPPLAGALRIAGSSTMAPMVEELTRRVPAGAAKAFIEFALSPAAREVILEHDFVPYLN